MNDGKHSVQGREKMTADRTNWFSVFSQYHHEQRRIRVNNPAGTSQNYIRCTDCGHDGPADVLPNSIEYNPTGWRQFDIGFLVARIVTLIWCLMALIGVVVCNILSIEAPVWAPQALLYGYAVALATSVAYAAVYMTPFDNCRTLVVVSAPALDTDRLVDVPYIASADLACSQCRKQMSKVEVTEVVLKAADPFK
ncbi:MAG: hypothetical protein JXQ99_00470 [Hyphomicrobiaceae bacterium]